VSARGDKEAVFSSSEDRIRDGGTAAVIIGPSVVRREATAGLAAVWNRLAGESLFSVLFPRDCRVCGLPLLNISQLLVCAAGLEAVGPADRNLASICGAPVSSSYPLSDDDGRYRCPLGRRTDRPFEQARARTGGTASRLGLTSHRRRKNLRRVFSVPRAQERTGREVLLVEDVYTTGATVSEYGRYCVQPELRSWGGRTLARKLESASKYEETDTVATTRESDFKVSKSRGFRRWCGC